MKEKNIRHTFNSQGLTWLENKKYVLLEEEMIQEIYVSPPDDNQKVTFTLFSLSSSDNSDVAFKEHDSGNPQEWTTTTNALGHKRVYIHSVNQESCKFELNAFFPTLHAKPLLLQFTNESLAAITLAQNIIEDEPSLLTVSSQPLTWIELEKTASLEEEMIQEIFVYPPDDNIKITFTLDNPNVAFKDHDDGNPQEWTTITNAFGHKRVHIRSVNKEPCIFVLRAFFPAPHSETLLLEFKKLHYEIILNNHEMKIFDHKQYKITGRLVSRLEGSDNSVGISNAELNIETGPAILVSGSITMTDNNGYFSFTITAGYCMNEQGVCASLIEIRSKYAITVMEIINFANYRG
ncbi:hypothetical protein [Xenorhabdus ishibashii]|uniref:Uncharacterized protein n=1 Tax=Xenorhabdus ishibashii TaxID=1034471 RepID=A0A2D0KAF4_9GAMM|nr:hypothetical protein [Xenorhabdus ishibashii]PHM60373.1 hypothetical protein Xish_03520 [Xenorhabdus ishibashii]